MDQALDSAHVELLRDCLIEALDDLALVLGRVHASKEAKHVFERALALREVLDDELHDLLDILLEGIDDRIGARIVRVRRLAPKTLLDAHAVVLNDERDDRTAHVVHVEDGRLGVERDGMELVRVRHRNLRELVEIARADRRGDGIHALRDDVRDAVLEERGSLDGALHAAGGGGALLVVGDDANEGVDFGPVRLGRDFDGEGVGTVGTGALFPGDEAAEKGAAGGSGALAGDEGEGGGGDGEFVELGEGKNKGGKSGCRRREAGGGGEVVEGRDVDMVCG